MLFHTNRRNTKMFLMSGLALLALASVGRAQSAVSAQLKSQAEQLQQDVDELNKSKSELWPRISASLLSTFNNELKAKESALASLQTTIHRAEALEQGVADLTALKEKMQGRASADLLSKLDQEVGAKGRALASLAPEEAITGHSAGVAQPTAPETPTDPAGPAPAIGPGHGPSAVGNLPPEGPAPSQSANPAVGSGLNAAVVTTAAVSNKTAASVISTVKGQSEQTSGASQETSVTANQQTHQGPGSAQESNSSQQPAKSGEWESRAIVGYHQAGASSASFTQNFFFDFFVARALSTKPIWYAPVNLWGDVRVASSPQQITSPVSSFVTGFADQITKVPVNQLAQGADFQSGLEFRLHTWDRANSYRMIGLVPYFGAMGTFQPPSASVQIFDAPSPQSPQYGLFAQDFPSAAKSKYIGFVPPDRDRFYRQYGLGVRITTFDKSSPLNPPATFTFGLGQDESVTGGVLRSVVGRFDVFYPLPLSTSKVYKFIYLFGTANLRLSSATNLQPLVLQNPNATSVTVNGYDPDVAIVSVRSNRDTYRIGVGVDLMALINSKFGSTTPNSATQQTPNPTPSKKTTQ